MSKSHEVYVRHILDEIQFLQVEASGLSKQQFLDNAVLQRAFVRSIEIIGEAVKNLSPEIKTEYREVDWKAIAGTRDKLIHGYFGVDYDIIWDIVAHELPNLRKTAEKILEAG